MGTTYGGNGRTTFQMPDLEGKLGVGIGSGAGLTPRVVGQQFGADAAPLSDANLPAPTGSSAPVDLVEESTAIRYMIVTSGLFPSRNGDVPNGGFDNLFIGQIVATAVAIPSAVPANMMEARGQLLQIADHQALFAIIGTTYGGDGRVTFALPDLQGRVPVGTGTGPGLSEVRLGQKLGVEDVALTQANLPPDFAGGSNQAIDTYQPGLGIRFLMSGGSFPSRDEDAPSGSGHRRDYHVRR